MLWDAGQQRISRESRERLTELYRGARDGYLAAEIAVGRVTARGDPTPPYARADEVAPPSAAAQAVTLARLATMFPGSVQAIPVALFPGSVQGRIDP